MVSAVCATLRTWGIGECVLKTDQEPAVMKLTDEVARQQAAGGHRCSVTAAHRASHASMGRVEKAYKQVGNGVRVLNKVWALRLHTSLASLDFSGTVYALYLFSGWLDVTRMLTV